MNKITFVIISLFLWNLSIAQDWTLSKNQEGIKVYTRPINGSSFKEFKGETEIEGTIESFVALFRDVPNFHLFFESAMNPKLFKREGDTLQIYYLQTQVPWPVTNRDGVYQALFRYHSAKKELYTYIKALPNYIEKETDFVRVPKVTGFWKVQQISPTKIHVIYQLHAEPGGAIPAWLANSGAVDLPFNTLQKLKKRIILPEYQNKKLPFK